MILKFQVSWRMSDMYSVHVAGFNLNFTRELYVPEGVEVKKYIQDWLFAEFGIDSSYSVTFAKRG